MSVLSPDHDRTIRQTTFWLIACVAVLLLQVLLEYWMGRTPICTCGYVKLFEPVVNSPGNSQHLADWYTPSHIIHGFIFYGIAHLLFRGKPLAARLLFAILIESGWELLENSPLIIDRYRTATISLDYYGDSVLNSVSDMLAMMLGFFLASRLPVWVSVLLIVGFEALTMAVIRDGLALNVLMLAWPLDAVRDWQAGLGR